MAKTVSVCLCPVRLNRNPQEPRAAEPGPNASDLGPSSSSEELHVAVPERGRRRRSPVGESKGVEESKGSGKKGKSKTNQCRYCQKRLGAHESSREQHEWTNEMCLRWQLWYRGYSWEEAERRAGALKEQRTSGVGENPSQEERRGKQRHKQERKDKKEKEKKKAKRPPVDPSPDPVRRRRRPRSSSEDSGEEHGNHGRDSVREGRRAPWSSTCLGMREDHDCMKVEKELGHMPLGRGA